ncbi:DUF1330 domain-containing protein [Streptosporangium algeriense]|uniref:DUF1330 domain-containing protein n=1 Tax=Streptosporangium algeriense TaxID=1682748 RepID=A0ABW3E4C4_9ACTN
MSAYVMVDVEVFDAGRVPGYQALAEPSIRLYGGRYLVRGAKPEAVEGTWPASRHVVVLEFPDMEQVRRWYSSPEYAEAIEARKGAMDIRLLFVEGVPGQEDPA